ncbi:MAG: RHS repeat-associated core domain-containing protein [Deltaproteobacteria bacterium]|nr:RHS repeat-associated core domain-containing protein [Deltaproteobacteria bacterium]MBW2395395.1 RHS repeat-associated core domain-containing protein [Deltaproteobacteria bacterium]
MKRPLPTRRSPATRILACLLALAIGLFGCKPSSQPLVAAPGLVETQLGAFVPFRFGAVNAIGGNLVVRRDDLSRDTRVGTRTISATYNSASLAWLWSFDMTYDGTTLVDESGATHDVAGLQDGDPIPGTFWVKVDASAIRWKGGLLLSFDAAGRLAFEHWTDGAFPRIEYEMQTVAGSLHTAGIQQCTAASTCTSLFSISYDGTGQVVGIDDLVGHQASFSWDAGGHLTSARDGLDLAEGLPGWSYEYSDDLLVAMVNSEGERIELDYDGLRVEEIREIGEENPVHQFHYQPENGGLYRTRYWDPMGKERIFAFDSNRQLMQIERVEVSETETWTWADKRPTSHTSPSGATTSWVWSNDDLASELQPSGNVVLYSYQVGGLDRESPTRSAIAIIQDSIGLVEQRSYDASGRMTVQTLGAGEITQFAYNGDGSLASFTRPNGVMQSFSGYGPHGHAAAVTVDGVAQTRVYDAVGNQIEGTAAEEPEQGGVWKRQYDADRNLRRIVLAPSGSADIVIDVRSDRRPTRVARPAGEDHEMAYDPLGRLTLRRERADGQWNDTAFEYEASGRQVASELPNGMRQEIDWDAAGRPSEMRALRNGMLEGTLTLQYAAGQLVSATDSLRGTTESFTNDTAGRTVLVDHGDGTFTAHSYDARSRRTGTQYVLGGQGLLRDLAFTHDLADRETEVWDGQDRVIERIYGGGRIDEIRYGNGLSRAFSYDPGSGLLSGSTTTDAGGSVVESTSITRDVFSGILSGLRTIVDSSTSEGVSASTHEEYWLGPVDDPADPAARSGKRMVAWSDGGANFRVFAHDAKSNMLFNGSSTFAYNTEGNRLLSMSEAGAVTHTYSYDAAGFATTRNGAGLTWTATGRLASHGANTFQWDMTGRLLSSTVSGTTTTRTFGGAVQADAAGAPIAIDLGDFAIDLTTGDRLYRHFDFRGNVKFTSDEQGTTLAHYQYSPYGVEQVYGATDDPVRFVGRAEIGELMILGFRIYDPAIGRFLSPDPVFQLINQYTYTLGNPVWFSDPDGREGISAEAFFDNLGAISAVIAAFSAILGNAAFALSFALLAALFHLIARTLAYIGNSSFVPMPGKASASSGGGGASGSGGGGGPSGGCSPVAAASLPDASRGLLLLLPLQLLLGLLILRRRRRD